MHPTDSKHTPGPWELRTPVSKFPHVAGVDGSVIAKFDSSMGRLPWIEDYNTAVANARLIAAAPELLEALKPLVERYLGDKDWVSCWGSVHPHQKDKESQRYLNEWYRARAAIRRAEGQE